MKRIKLSYQRRKKFYEGHQLVFDTRDSWELARFNLFTQELIKKSQPFGVKWRHRKVSLWRIPDYTEVSNGSPDSGDGQSP